ncbi:MAG TPA: ATPase [Spirochaetota bacterium]|nr:ATPase [Spirochaetota bacterium]HOF01588.1 ATPase [Spirochaetota bacterium]HOS34026.1 ATPase [Spirochaetota bacterium]HOS56105.1 ATPase [Spirochaetota bacterium]HPY87778.1 ATPase [Spirochaetota bacterium]
MNSAFIVAAIGLGLMIGLSGSGSAIGLVISGSSAMGSLKKRPEAFGALLVASILPSTQGIYGFVGYFIYSDLVTPDISMFNASLVLGAGLMLGIVALVSAIYQGKICASSASAIGSGHEVLGQGLVFGALPEFYAILALVASILLKNLAQ